MVLGEIFHSAEVYKSAEASQWRVCYQWGLPRLVFYYTWLKCKVPWPVHSALTQKFADYVDMKVAGLTSYVVQKSSQLLNTRLTSALAIQINSKDPKKAWGLP